MAKTAYEVYHSVSELQNRKMELRFKKCVAVVALVLLYRTGRKGEKEGGSSSNPFITNCPREGRRGDTKTGGCTKVKRRKSKKRMMFLMALVKGKKRRREKTRRSWSPVVVIPFHTFFTGENGPVQFAFLDLIGSEAHPLGMGRNKRRGGKNYFSLFRDLTF